MKIVLRRGEVERPARQSSATARRTARPHDPQRRSTAIHRCGADPSTADFDGICDVPPVASPTALDGPGAPATFLPRRRDAPPPEARRRLLASRSRSAPKEPHDPAVTPDPAPIWTRLQAELRRRVPDATYDIWLAPLAWGDLDAARVVLHAPADVRDWVGQRFASVLEEAARVVVGPEATVELLDVAAAGAAATPSA